MSHYITRETVEQKYENYRLELIAAINLLSLEPGLVVTSFNDEALKRALRWKNFWTPSCWDKEIEIYRRTKPKRLELAFWKDGVLLAVTLGHPTRHGTGLRLNLVQAAPKTDRNDLKMLPIILLAYDLFAGMINCEHIRVVNPLNDQLIQVYRQHGFSELRRNPQHRFQCRKVST